MLMLKIRIFWCAIIFSFVTSSSAYTDENCTFSEEAISEKQYLDSNSIAVFQWFPKSHEVKGVLSNGNLFSVKHWSCNHYGKQAIMVMGPQIRPIPSELNDHIMQLGKIALSEAEFKLLISSLEGKPLKLSDSPITLRVISKEFDEFYVRTNIVGESIFIEIKLYKA